MSDIPSETGVKTLRRGRRRRIYIQAMLRDPVSVLAMLVLMALVVLAVLGSAVAPYDPFDQIITDRLLPPLSPSSDPSLPVHWLGTDQLGRDFLSRVILGARVSLSVGVVAVIMSGLVGVTMGLTAGYFRGRIDDILMRIADLQMAFPALILALFVLFAVGPGFVNMLLVMAVIRWPVYARVSRGLALNIGGEQYVESSRALGASPIRILWEHVRPNVTSPLLILATLELAFMIMFEATLSFLGFGVQPPGSSWGLMIAQGREYIVTAWWLVVLPGLFLLAAALSINLIAAWAQNVTDPTQRAVWLRRGLKGLEDGEQGQREISRK